MRFFPKRFSVCEQCHVHFEPFEGEGAHLCSVHRGEWVDLQRRKKAVVLWAQCNWEKLEAQMKAEHDRLTTDYVKAQQAAYAQAQQSPLGGQLGGLGAGSPFPYGLYQNSLLTSGGR